MYSGWIIAEEEDRDHLESLGFSVSEYDNDKNEYQIKGEDSCLDRLDPFWGRYIWGLKSEKKEAGE